MINSLREQEVAKNFMNQSTVSTQPISTDRGYWHILAASVFWGTTGTAQAFAPEGAQPAVVGAIRMLVGGSAMLLLALSLNVFQAAPPWPKKATFFAACGVAIYQLCFFAGVAKTGVAIGTLVTMGSSPVFAGLLGWFLLQERPGMRWGVATMFAVFGCGLFVAAGGQLHLDPLGILAALGAGGGYALYSVCGKDVLSNRSSLAGTAAICSCAALLLLPVLFLGDTHWLAQPRGIFVALHLGLIATATPYLLFARGLLTTPVATAVTLTLAEPLTAGTLGVLVLGERFTPLTITGIACILSGLLILFVKRRG